MNVKSAWLNVWNDAGLYAAAMMDREKPDIVRVGPVVDPDPIRACADLIGKCCKRCGANERKAGERFCQGCRATAIRELHKSSKFFWVPPDSKWQSRDPVGPYSAGSDGSWENAVGLLEDSGDCEGIGGMFCD